MYHGVEITKLRSAMFRHPAPEWRLYIDCNRQREIEQGIPGLLVPSLGLLRQIMVVDYVAHAFSSATQCMHVARTFRSLLDGTCIYDTMLDT